ncbi:selenocysteine-specific translation elongation factor [Thermoanaerobacterium sp. RBIITD]|uniref:selenocysteine-specific translation elongation factor n=1 Tax=Thermoanaerobacterium sp. RBIITD TaxID=1550240 RepID=UPI000BB93D5B|nr:selenocysteine-specific translation elongation factor [Thermoanaerobacterium sp. RBIITD]SNX55174.1 selenocysteine-specific translation elongation factor SelB [Thermoanaerobacterium sp. RBIITD]
MKHIIIGTAGHIDHGKTALIKALTGNDTDRLKEEKQRGITIDLGFTYFDLPSGVKAGVIDVPGHEKFIKNMLAGAHGIDIVLVVIAADEGVMPQTKEHIDILTYLGIKNGIVVITKCDKVDNDWLRMVKDDIKEYLKDTFLKDAPIIEVSSLTDYGIKELIGIIDNKAKEITEKNFKGIFRLPIDRVFTVHGFGTVVTGTLISGTITNGDIIEIYPEMIITKVRNIQVHDANVDRAYAGQRTALNIADVKKDEISRGDVIAPPDVIEPSKIVDVKLSLLKNKSIKNRERIRLYTGASETIGRVVLLDRDVLNGNESTYAQIILEKDVCVLKDDRFVIRSYSPMITIGGGIILIPNAVKLKRFKYEAIEELKKIYENGDLYLLEKYIYNSILPIPIMDVSKRFNIPDIQDVIDKMTSLLKINVNGVIYLYHKKIYEGIQKNAKDYLSNYHKKYPLREGVSKEELIVKLFGNLKSKLTDYILKLMEDDKVIKINAKNVSLYNFNVTLTHEQKNIEISLLRLYETAKYNVKRPREIEDYDNILPVFNYMVEKGELVKINDYIYLTQNNFNNSKEILINYLKDNNDITLAIYRDLLGTSRRIAIGILEYFDAIKLTKKVGDIRILNKGFKNS